MKSVTDILAENIKAERKRRGMTQEALAARLGYSVKAISKWESGRGTPPTVILPLLAKVLQTEVGTLLCEGGEGRLYLGIDGGGTKTELALADETGILLQTVVLGSSNPNDIGIESALSILREGISEVCAGIPKSRISLFAGLAGGGTADVKEKLASFLDGFGFARSAVGSDAENAVSAGLGQQNGVVCILGTGSVVFAQQAGKLHRVGGYGYLLGDAGSGFALGRDAVLAALQYEDGSGAPTALYEAVKEKCGTERVLDALGAFYRGGKRRVAEFAACVLDAYARGDDLSTQILMKNLAEVAEMVHSAAARLECARVPVVLCGGVACAYADTVRDLLADLLTKKQKQYVVSLSRRRPVYGALALAGMPVREDI